MPRDMFGDIVDPSIKVGSKQWYTVPLSIVVHTAIIGAVVIIPLMAARHAADAAVDDGVRGGAAAAPAAAAAAAAAAGRPQAPKPVDGRRTRRPRRSKRRKRSRRRPASKRASRAPSAASKAASSAVSTGGIVGGLEAAPPPPPPPPPPAPVRVGGTIQQPTKIKDVKPGLSADRAVGARAGRRHHRSDHRARRPGAGSQGAALDSAARRGGARRGQAVAVYTPTLLNGVPVPVIMTVTVNFTLQ